MLINQMAHCKPETPASKRLHPSLSCVPRSVRTRMESESGISFTEFTYQLLQGYDFVHLCRELGVRVQVRRVQCTVLSITTCNQFGCPDRLGDNCERVGTCPLVVCTSLVWLCSATCHVSRVVVMRVDCCS